MMWSLLHIGDSPAPVVHSQVMTDLKLTSLFDHMVLKVLACPCNTDTILARQELFRMLEDSNFMRWFQNLRESIGEFSYQTNRLASVKTELEGCFVFQHVIVTYQKLLTSCTNSYNAVFLKRLSEQAKQELEFTVPCQQMISQYAQILKGFMSFTLQLRGNDYCLVPNHATLPKSIAQTIEEDARALFPEIPLSKSSFNNQIPVGIVNALTVENEHAYAQLTDLKKELEKTISWRILQLKDEITFYLKMSIFLKNAKDKGAAVCFPEISDEPVYWALDVIDPTLFTELSGSAVPNDIDFRKDKAIYWLCGTNGGGKTTYLRAVASNLLLFLAGCPVLSRDALIYPFRMVMTHFPADERFNEGGRMNEEQTRVQTILDTADSKTFVFFNETFSSTNVRKGQQLGEELMLKLKKMRCFCLFVTHLISMECNSIPVLTAMTDSENGNAPTYRIAEDIDANYHYVQKILQKYRMDKASLYRRKYD